MGKAAASGCHKNAAMVGQAGDRTLPLIVKQGDRDRGGIDVFVRRYSQEMRKQVEGHENVVIGQGNHLASCVVNSVMPPGILNYCDPDKAVAGRGCGENLNKS